MISTQRNIVRATGYADVVVGAVLVLGERTPILINREMVQAMKPRSIIIDVSIDQGGCVETSRPTTHEHPVFIEEGITHYCVPNIPGVVARTATHAFVNAAMPYIMEITEQGLDATIAANPSIEVAINAYAGELRHLSRFNNEKGLDDGLD